MNNKGLHNTTKYLGSKTRVFKKEMRASGIVFHWICVRTTLLQA